MNMPISYKPNVTLPRVMALVLALLATRLYAAEPATDITGYWVMSDGSALVEIIASQAGLSARIAALRDPQFTVADGEGVKSPVGEPRLDVHNPDPRLRGRSLLGLTIARGLRFDRGRWRGGRIYDPATGKSWRCEMEPAPGGYLKVRGYVGMAALGRTQYWQRPENYRETITAMLPDSQPPPQ
jgi:uncharacterized protein (DUF2147 family)